MVICFGLTRIQLTTLVIRDPHDIRVRIFQRREYQSVVCFPLVRYRAS